MSKNKTKNFRASPEFLDRMKKLQGKIKAMTGREPSLTELINEISRLPNFEDLEKQILGKLSKEDLIKLKFDRNLK